eukprot:Hpha_TRINITY_DN21749_c0_g1::TRINITY_DN21749_c0_g1_i1::g.194145::m.194145
MGVGDAQVQFAIRKHKNELLGAAAVSAIVGGGGAAAVAAAAPTSAGKLALISELSDCPSEDLPGESDDMEFSTNPFMVGMTGSHTKLNVGASVFNTVVILPSIALVHLLACFLVSKLKSNTTLRQGMALLYFP